MIWIEQAIKSGGTLTVRPERLLGSGITCLRAIMVWPMEESIASDIAESVEFALQDLDQRLLEDAADEMIKKGAV